MVGNTATEEDRSSLFSSLLNLQNYTVTIVHIIANTLLSSQLTPVKIQKLVSNKFRRNIELKRRRKLFRSVRSATLQALGSQFQQDTRNCAVTIVHIIVNTLISSQLIPEKIQELVNNKFRRNIELKRRRKLLRSPCAYDQKLAFR